MKTIRVGLLGHPLRHTMSPFIHRGLFALSGRDHEYFVRDVPPEALAETAGFLKTLDWFNITIPYKSAVIPFLDRLDGSAALYGSVNTVLAREGRHTGFNTDGEGFLTALSLGGLKLEGNVCVLGNGGTARMMAFEAARRGCRVTLAARSPEGERCRALLAELEEKTKIRPEARPLEGLRGRFDLICNATPVGMYPHAGESPVEAAALEGCGGVFDAVYNPRDTRLLQLCRRLGVPCVGGMAMLVAQAAAAHRLSYGAEFSPSRLLTLTQEANGEMERLFSR